MVNIHVLLLHIIYMYCTSTLVWLVSFSSLFPPPSISINIIINKVSITQLGNCRHKNIIIIFIALYLFSFDVVSAVKCSSDFNGKLKVSEKNGSSLLPINIHASVLVKGQIFPSIANNTISKAKPMQFNIILYVHPPVAIYSLMHFQMFTPSLDGYI